MRKILSFIIGVILLLNVGCDVIEPFEDGTYIERPDLEEAGDTIESIILFEFTGWACIGCPIGHEMIHLIEDNYPERVHAIAIHAGFFAEPGNDGPDFRCNDSDDLLERFNNPNAFPQGSVNSMNFDDLTSPDAWSSIVAAAFQESENNPQAFIKFSQSITAEKISAEIVVEFSQELTGDYNLSVFVVENGVVAPQKHFSEGLIEEYEHSHILRASMNNGIIGDLVATNPTVGTEFEKSFSLNIDTEWVADSLHVIPYIYNTETNIVIPTKVIKPKTK